MTLAVRFDSMEHYRSVGATTAIIVLGLVGASHLAYPRVAEDARGPITPAITVAVAEAPAWVDPPRRIDAAAPVVRPAAFTLLEPETRALLASASIVADTAASAHAVEGFRPAHVARRTRSARAVARVRTVAAAQPDIGAPAAPAAGDAAPQPSAKPDPIGDLLRGLGIGREG